VLYDFKQASRSWHLSVKDFESSFGFEAPDADPCLVALRYNWAIVFVFGYADDVLTAGSSLVAIENIKRKVLHKFEAKNMGETALFLDTADVRRHEDKLLWLHQGRYARDVVEWFGTTAAPVHAPMAREVQLRWADAGGEPTSEPYAEVVGSLMHLLTCAQPDLAQAVGALSLFVSDLRRQHWLATEKVLRYVLGKLGLGLQFGGKRQEVRGCCDADYMHSLHRSVASCMAARSLESAEPGILWLQSARSGRR
jgi:hypothetical protein